MTRHSTTPARPMTRRHGRVVIPTLTALALAAAGLSACNRNGDAIPGSASRPSVGGTAADRSTATGGGMTPSTTATADATTGSTAATATGTTPADAGTTKSSAAMTTTAATPTADTTTTGANSASGSGPLPAADAQFLKTAAEGGLFEVAVGQLAADKATNPDVKAFGKMLVEQHSAANDKLRQIASSHNVTLPTAVPADKQKTIDMLSKLSGPAFDRQFVQTVGIKDHKTDIAAFEKASRSAKAPDVREFAAQTLPTLHAHLSSAQKLPARGAKPGTGSGNSGSGN